MTMTELFLDPKVMNYQGDKYELINLTLRWAKTLKAKGSPEPMAALVDRALKEIVENKVTKEEIMAIKLPEPAPAEETPSIVSVAEEGPGKELKLELPADDEDDDKKSKKKKAKKKDDAAE
jgi:DNA-directed RNA polymerase subunit K/omega